MSGRTVWVATLAFFLAVHGAAMSAEEAPAPRSAAKPGSVLALAGIEAGVTG